MEKSEEVLHLHNSDKKSSTFETNNHLVRCESIKEELNQYLVRKYSKKRYLYPDEEQITNNKSNKKRKNSKLNLRI
jgi:hypothetical protein